MIGIIIGLLSFDEITRLRLNPVYREHIMKWSHIGDNFNVNAWTYLDNRTLETTKKQRSEGL
jgi:hypothetical protein